MDPSLEATLDSSVQPTGLMAKKKPAATSSSLQTRTTRQKTAVATATRPVVTARVPAAVPAAKPPPAKGDFLSWFCQNLCEIVRSRSPECDDY